MSTNIYINAVRQIKVLKTNRIDEQWIQFSAYQTPTKVTYEILNNESIESRIQAYKNYILTQCSHDEELDIYADDDVFGEGEPVGKEIYNAGKDHVALFDEWLEMCATDGYDVYFEAG